MKKNKNLYTGVGLTNADVFLSLSFHYQFKQIILALLDAHEHRKASLIPTLRRGGCISRKENYRLFDAYLDDVERRTCRLLHEAKKLKKSDC